MRSWNPTNSAKASKSDFDASFRDVHLDTLEDDPSGMLVRNVLSETDSRMVAEESGGGGSVEVREDDIVEFHTPPSTRTLSPAGLMIMIYFWTCGGPFGIESAVSAGGAGLTFVSLFVILILWCLPQALMAAELSLMINQNGGNVTWVQRAFGDFIGFINAFCALFMNLDNQAILTLMFLEYLPVSLQPGYLWLIKGGFLFITTLINIWSVDAISKLSWALLFIVFTPFFGEIVYVVAQRVPITFNTLFVFPEFSSIKWNILLSTIVWNFGGLDLIGFVAGEVKGGSRGFLAGVLGAFPLIFINYSFPVLVNYILYPHYSQWDSGFFVQLAEKLFPSWLVLWMTIATCTGVFGTQLSSATTTSRLIWAMGKGKEDNIAQHRYLPHFFAKSWMNKEGVLIPIVATITNGLVTFALTAFPLDFLIQFFLILRILNLWFEYAALIYLKWKEPDTARPFEIPGKRVGSVIIVIPTVFISVLAIVTTDGLTLAWSGGVVGLSVVLYLVKMGWVYWTNQERRAIYQQKLGIKFTRI